MSDLFEQMAADSAAAALKNAPTEEQALSVRQIGVQLVELDSRIERGTRLLKDLVAERETIMRRTLVDAMDAIHLDSMGLAEHEVDIVTSNFYHASLPSPAKGDTAETIAHKAELRAGGLAWLVEAGHDSLIKTVVTVELPRGSRDQALEIRRMVAGMTDAEGVNCGYSASVEETVHWATLTSFVREQTEKGAVLPLEKLGAVVGRIAKIIKRRKK